MSDSLEGVYAPLNVDQLAKVTAFLEATHTVEKPPSFVDFLSHHPVLFATKWLVARKWDVQNAVTMFTEAAAWRIAEGFETRGVFPSCLSVKGYDEAELIKHQGHPPRPTNEYIDKANAVVTPSCYAAAWHKWDKEGRPCYIERSGLTKVHALVQKCQAATAPGESIEPIIVEPHKHWLEVGAHLQRYQNRKRQAQGKFVCQAVVIMDCAGMSMSSFYGPAMDLLKANSTMDQKYVPEGMHKCFLVNAPSFIKIGWALVRLWIDEETEKKFVFAAPGEASKKILLEHFDEEHLPSFLGGTCNCEGGCVLDVDETAAAAEQGPQTVNVNVRARSCKTIDTPVAAGSKITWQFVSDNSVDFSVSFTSSDKSRGVLDLHRAKGTTKSADNSVLVAPSDGIFTLKFDNSFSWVTSKKVQLRVDVQSA